METYIAGNETCFMVYQSMHHVHLKEVGLMQNWEIIALQNLTTSFIIAYCVEGST